MNSKSRNVRFLVAIGLSSAIWASNVAYADNPECSDNGGLSPYVCVWKSGADPVEGTNFWWGWGDPDNPDVTLITGDTLWEVWSQVDDEDDTPANLGDLDIRPAAESSEYFTVKIVHGEIAGAANLGSAVLDAGNWTGYSSITGGSITGNLTGNLTVKQDAGNNGGDINFEIGGSVMGDITAYTITSLEIGEDTSGNISVTTLSHLTMRDVLEGTIWVGTIAEDGDLTIRLRLAESSTRSASVQIDAIERGGEFHVGHSVGTNAAITIGQMTPEWNKPIKLDFGDAPGGTGKHFAGDLTLTYGLPAYARAWFYIPTEEGSSVDLTNDPLAGNLTLYEGGDINIVNGGAVTGTAVLAWAWPGGTGVTYDGSAQFASVGLDGEVHLLWDASLTGSITVTGDLEGSIWLDRWGGNGGNLEASGKIRVEGTVSHPGIIDIRGVVKGDIELVGEDAMYCGRLKVVGDVLSTSDITVGNMTSPPPYPPQECTYSLLDFQADFGGDLTLTSGISANQHVEVAHNVESNADIFLMGDVAGVLSVGMYIEGDIFVGNGQVTPDVTNDGTITVGKSLGANARVIVWGACDGAITIDEETGWNSLIACFGGLEDDGNIIINNGQWDGKDANGTIHVGQAVMTDPLLDVTFDGCILIREGPTSGGDLGGTIKVVGCHADTEDLDICIEGTENGTIDIVQDDCPNQVTDDCEGGCY
jgi:hypothetical protein